MRIGIVALFLSLIGSSALAEGVVITVPGQGWTISFDAPPLKRFAGQSGEKDFQYRGADESGFTLSLFVEPPPKESKLTAHEACYDHYWTLAKRNPLIDEASVKVDKQEKFVRVSYEMKVGKAGGVLNRHANYYFIFNGRWVDFHISTVSSDGGYDKIFDAFEKHLAYELTKP